MARIQQPLPMVRQPQCPDQGRILGFFPQLPFTSGFFQKLLWRINGRDDLLFDAALDLLARVEF